jgi:hypothetical protein
MSTKHSKNVASRMREFDDAHAEFKETKSEEARLRRQRAMHGESPEMAQRMGQRMATELVNEKERRKDADRKRSRSPWQPKE